MVSIGILQKAKRIKEAVQPNHRREIQMLLEASERKQNFLYRGTGTLFISWLITWKTLIQAMLMLLHNN